MNKTVERRQSHLTEEFGRFLGVSRLQSLREEGVQTGRGALLACLLIANLQTNSTRVTCSDAQARLQLSVTDAAAAAEASSRRSAARRRLWRTGCRPFVAAGSRSSGRGSSCRPPCIYSDGTKHGEAVSAPTRSSWKRFAREYLFMGFFCLFI